MPSQTATMITGAELLAVAGAAILGGTLAASYLADQIAGGIAPGVSVLVALAAATAIVATFRHHTRWGRRDVAVYLSIVTATLIYLLMLAWPSLLPLGGGPDLTHHLQLVDYIERHGHLVHEADATQALGEMAHYTPGLHLLAVIAGTVLGSDGFHTIYPVVALTVALKIGAFVVILRRYFAASAIQLPLVAAGSCCCGRPGATRLALSPTIRFWRKSSRSCLRWCSGGRWWPGASGHAVR